jgi:multidrug efflux pump subunit AcrA (membrane-fusion protein)
VERLFNQQQQQQLRQLQQQQQLQLQQQQLQQLQQLQLQQRQPTQQHQRPSFLVGGEVLSGAAMPLDDDLLLSLNADHPLEDDPELDDDVHVHQLRHDLQLLQNKNINR